MHPNNSFLFSWAKLLFCFSSLALCSCQTKYHPDPWEDVCELKHLKEGMYPARATYLDKDLSPLDALDCYSEVWVDVEKSGKYSIVLPEYSVPGSATKDPEIKELLREMPLAKHFTIAGCDTSLYDVDFTNKDTD